MEPPPPYPPPAPRPAGTNGFAVAALIFGAIGGVGLALIFGVIALIQIRKRGQPGKGLAIWGLVLAGVWTLVIVAGVAFFLLTEAERDRSGTVTEAGSLDVDELRAGDCANDVGDEGESAFAVDVVPCSAPHDAEVVGTSELPGDDFPGTDSVVDMAESRCTNRLATYSPAAMGDPEIELFFVHPTEESWQEGDRNVVCFAIHRSGMRSGSLRAS
ncbi:MAG: septum formation family protein [Actinobacteria bacterium]|nr:septum formation family protein [Actinomycetota bacterium]